MFKQLDINQLVVKKWQQSRANALLVTQKAEQVVRNMTFNLIFPHAELSNYYPYLIFMSLLSYQELGNVSLKITKRKKRILLEMFQCLFSKQNCNLAYLS